MRSGPLRSVRGRPMALMGAVGALCALVAQALAQQAPPTRLPPGKVDPGRPSLRPGPDNGTARPSALEPEAVIVDGGGVAFVRSVAFASGFALARDAAGRMGQRELGRVGALVSTLPPAPVGALDAPEGEARGVLALPDGQRFPGTLVVERSTRERLVWRSAVFGLASAPMSRVASVRFDRPGEGAVAIEDASGGVAPLADTVVLTNGDRITGFVESIGEDVVVAPGGGGEKMRAELGRVSAIVFAAAPEPSRGPLVWLSDGTVARVASIEPAPADAQGAAVSPGRRPVTLTLPTGASGVASLGAIVALTGGRDRLVALSSARALGERIAQDQWRPAALETRDPSRRGPFEAVGCREVFIPGQRVATFAIPAGARALVGEAGLPERAGEFAAAEIGVWVDGRPVWRAAVGSKSRSAGLAVAIPAGARELTVTVSAAGGGAGNALAELRQCVFVMGEMK